MKYIRDPIHEEIGITENVLSLVDHPLFQRLRNISQLALVRLVYPSATHSRFEHSLGVYHITRHFSDNEVTHVYALLHDVGHVAFSHLTETALREMGIAFDHDEHGKEIRKEILQDSVFSFQEVEKNPENLIVHGSVGTDRMDYLLRDSYFTGVKIGFIDWRRLVRNVYIEDGRLYIKRKILPNVEHFFIARFVLGDAVYMHKTVLIADTMFIEAIKEFLEGKDWKILLSMDEYDLVRSLREEENRWWRMLEERRLFKMVFQGEEEETREVYEELVSEIGEGNVVMGRRHSFYKKPEAYVEGGGTVIQESPLIRSLRRAEESRSYWFVAVHPDYKHYVKRYY